MAEKMTLEVVTPTGKVVKVETASVTAPGSLGELGILPDHRPALIQLGGGAIKYDGGQVFVRGGVAEVRPGGVLVLADRAARPDQVDRAEVEALLKQTLEALQSRDYLNDVRLADLSNDRAFAEAVLHVAGH
ncbi:MAG: ATP synthase F1 subunit epsilon [Myxococcales bacterium]|nr:ATP synthase F1 subunit epsilon [Myxococcales bacterium]